MSKQIVRVHGHIRSGNHALASFVHKAFYPQLPPLHIHRSGSGHWNKDLSPLSRVTVDGQDAEAEEVDLPYGHVLGGHLLPRSSAPKIYIFRDGRDVALSIWRWEKMRPPGVETFSEFLRYPIDWRFSLGRHFAWPEHTTVLDHWKWHIEQWIHHPKVLAIRYEEFVQNPRKVLRRITQALRRDPVAVPENTMAGWNASKAPKISRWKDEMSTEDVEFYNQKIPQRFIGRWD